jgi:hypothetical protein
MNPYGEIPIEHVIRMNPSIEDPVKVSEIYTCTTQDFLSGDNKTLLFKVPFSPGTFWTHFKFTCTDLNGFSTDELDIDVQLLTTDNYSYTINNNNISTCISNNNKKVHKVWHPFTWAIPSLYTPNKGIYLKVQAMPDSQRYFFNIKLLGFKELYPASSTYLLEENGTPQFVFSDNGEQVGTIYRVEHNDYVNQLNNAVSIQSQSEY